MKIGYGGKLTRANYTACAAAVACYNLNKTVRVALDLNSASQLIGKFKLIYFKQLS